MATISVDLDFLFVSEDLDFCPKNLRLYANVSLDLYYIYACVTPTAKSHWASPNKIYECEDPFVEPWFLNYRSTFRRSLDR